MNILTDDLNREFLLIKDKLEKGITLTEEDFKAILLNTLHDEDSYESKQPQ